MEELESCTNQSPGMATPTNLMIPRNETMVETMVCFVSQGSHHSSYSRVSSVVRNGFRNHPQQDTDKNRNKTITTSAAATSTTSTTSTSSPTSASSTTTTAAAATATTAAMARGVFSSFQLAAAAAERGLLCHLGAAQFRSRLCCSSLNVCWQPMRNTTRHSRPLALWIVDNVTASLGFVVD